MCDVAWDGACTRCGRNDGRAQAGLIPVAGGEFVPPPPYSSHTENGEWAAVLRRLGYVSLPMGGGSGWAPCNVRSAPGDRVLRRNCIDAASQGHRRWRNPTYIVDAFTDPWKQIYSSPEFKNAVAAIKQKYADYHPDHEESGIVPVEYTSGPLSYAVGKGNVEYTYTPKGDSYTITIKLTDTFDFDRFLTLTSLFTSFKGSLANDYARMLQFTGSLVPFKWETYPILVYGKR